MRSRFVRSWLVLLLLFSLGCLCLPEGLNLLTTASQTPVVTREISPQTVESRTPTLTLQAATPASPLNLQGPWFLIETYEGLWATNPDGTSVNHLTDVDYWNGDLQKAVQPGGNLVAFIDPPGFDFHGMGLYLLSVPDLAVIKVTALTGEQTEPYADSAPGDPGFEALRAVRDEHNLAWSPDGARLAFVGAMDGPSADIYMYEVATGLVTRLSQDDVQNYWPSWSPDGYTLAYLGSEGFGSGAGFETKGAWSVRMDGSAPILLENFQGGNAELLCWRDETSLVISNWTAAEGHQNLHMLHTGTLQSVLLEAGPFRSAACDGSQVLIASDTGLFLINAGEISPLPISDLVADLIEPVQTGEYYFTAHLEDGTFATFGSSEFAYQRSPVGAECQRLEVSMYGYIWGWTCEQGDPSGAWITGPGVEFGQIFTGEARLPTWDTHNNLLFFSSQAEVGYSLFRTTFDNYYADLQEVAVIPASVISVAWLGNE